MESKPQLLDRVYGGKHLEVSMNSGFWDAWRESAKIWGVYTTRPGDWANTLELYRTEKVAGGVCRKREEQGHKAAVFEYSAEEVQHAGNMRQTW